MLYLLKNNKRLPDQGPGRGQRKGDSLQWGKRETNRQIRKSLFQPYRTGTLPCIFSFVCGIM